MKKYIFILIAPWLGHSQETPVELATESITSKFPLVRNFSLQYEANGATDYDNELFGQQFQQGRLGGNQRLRVAANLPLYKKPRFVVNGSFWYKYERYDVEKTFTYPTQDTRRNYSHDFHYLLATGSFTYFSSLFKKPVIYNAALTVDGNEDGPQRVKGLASALMVIKKTDRTTFTVGILALIDKSSMIPFAPIVTYEHQFKDSPWALDIIIPQRILLKRLMMKNGMLAIGPELISENFYVELDTPHLSGTYEFNQLNIRTGITYEHKIAKNLFGTLKSGINTPIRARLTERGDKTSKYVLENLPNNAFYMNFGISYNPF